MAWDIPSPWRKRNPKWNQTDLKTAVHSQCRQCNDVLQAWHEGNDCLSPECPLWPFRPGDCRPEVDGIHRAQLRPVSEKRRESSRKNMIHLVAHRSGRAK